MRHQTITAILTWTTLNLHHLHEKNLKSQKTKPKPTATVSKVPTEDTKEKNNMHLVPFSDTDKDNSTQMTQNVMQNY